MHFVLHFVQVFCCALCSDYCVYLAILSLAMAAKCFNLLLVLSRLISEPFHVG